MNVTALRTAVQNSVTRSAWDRGVVSYALDMLNAFTEAGETEFYGSPYDRKVLLNGADDWLMASEGGSFLIYDSDIAERLCSPSELKRKRGGDLEPNDHENWLQAQRRALVQAESLLCIIARRG